jgi:hypothetical protein
MVLGFGAWCLASQEVDAGNYRNSKKDMLMELFEGLE